MRRLLLSVVLVLAALVVQLTVLNRLPLPGGVSPDLVLLVVVALALSSGPMPGMLTGFGAGLALDIAPPSNHLVGVYALVFCLAGYCCGRVAADLDSSVLLPLAASAAGAAGGAALYAGVGILLSDPDVTSQAVRHVLPETVLYDVLLSPFVLYGVALCFRANASRLAAWLVRAPAGGPQFAGGSLAGGSLAGGSLGGSAALPAGRTPRIRAASARSRDGWIGGGGWLAASAELARSRPLSARPTVRLHLGGKRRGGALSSRITGQPGASKSLARLRFGGGRRGDGVLGGRLPGGGFFAGLVNSGRARPRTPRLLRRRSRLISATSARFSRRPAWGVRGAGLGGTGASVPRRGSFSASSRRKAAASAATPRRGTFTTPPQRKRIPASGSPRRGSFSGGSSTRGTFGAGSPRRGAFGGARRFRALRRSLRATRRSGYPGTRSAVGRVRGGRSPGFRSTGSWRIRYKRNGG